MDKRAMHYIGGEWCDPAPEAGGIEVINPATETVIGHVAAGGAVEVDKAVVAAAKAFPEWALTPLDVRRDYLKKLRDSIFARRRDFARMITDEVGTPARTSRGIQLGLPLAALDTMAETMGTFPFEEKMGTSVIVREPAGVVAAITPWNYPLQQVIAKLAPALAAGCTFVLKPSEVAPLSVHALAEVLEEVGLPPGVFNLVNGTGPVVGEALAVHPLVDMVSFTGSTGAGKRVHALASATVKRVALELGGKSALVILDDADIEAAVNAGMSKAYLNGGQTCSALTRFVVPRAILADVEEIAKTAAEANVIGDPQSDETTLGPMVSSQQRDRVRAYIAKGLADGCTMVTGGDAPPEGLDVGYFVRPTVFSRVGRASEIARDEIFGPVVSIIAYDTDEEATEIANDSIYGLSGSVWGDPERALGVARKIRTGQVDINGGRYNPAAPFGGYKQSGNSRELGRYGLEEYLEIKAIQL